MFEVGWIVSMPALLLTMVGSTVLGITLLVRVPRRGCQRSCSLW
jgi:hypothetical protein